MLHVTDERKQVEFAASLLQGHASLWYQTKAGNGDTLPFSTWEEFSTALKKQFTPVNQAKRARDKLADLRQTSSARKYITDFLSLGLEIPDLAPVEQLDRFIRGLKPHIRRELELKGVATFEEATTLAERVDEITYRSSYRGTGQPAPTPRQGPEPMDIGTTRVDGAKQRLTPELREQLRKEGRCRYCREVGHDLDVCPTKPSRRFPHQGNGKWRQTKGN